jgi:molybdopterin synthase sulfur carrier subunit
MLKVVFFARVREQLGCDGLELPWDPALASVAELERRLISQHGERWAQVLAEQNLVRAVNHAVVVADSPLVDNDEVAFYPPVTGG